jgi:hypothetical protein
MDDSAGGGGYSPLFYIMLVIGIIGLIGFLITAGAAGQ